MPNNLHISYDLYKPGQDYEALIKAIKSLGAYTQIHKSFWYVSSSYNAPQAVNLLWPKMDKNDKLYVVDATNNNASWQNLADNVSSFIIKHWKQAASGSRFM